jgi:drug/metabolite transporter (DMT)-like permease
MAGMAVLCDVRWRDLRIGKGEGLTLLASVVFAGQILWLDRREFASCDKTRASLVQCAVIAMMFAPFAVLLAAAPRDLWTASASLPALGMQATLALGCAVGAFLLMNHWQPKLQPTRAGLIYCAEPVFASLYAMLLPAWLGRMGGFSYANEQLTANLWIGGGLITLANVAIQFAPREERA